MTEYSSYHAFERVTQSIDGATTFADHMTAQLLAMSPAQRAQVLTDLVYRFPPPDARHSAEPAPQPPDQFERWWPWTEDPLPTPKNKRPRWRRKRTG